MADLWDLAPPVNKSAAATGSIWDAAPVLGGTPVAGRQAQSIYEAVVAGLQSSATGLAVRGKLPEQQLAGDAPWYYRAASAAGNVAADLPLSVVGAVAGGAAGSAAAPGPGTFVGAAAGSFAVPMALREALVEAYNGNHATSWQGVWDIAKAALVGGVKGAVIGGATAGVGSVAARGVGAAIAPGIGTAMTVKGAERVIGATALGAELATLTTTSAAVEGHMPTWQDFMDNAILLAGMKGATAAASGLRNVFAETGRRPEQVVLDAQKDPALKAELLREAPGANGEWQHMAQSKISALRDEPMWFSKVGSDFYGSDRAVGTFKAQLNFKKPLIESEVTPEVATALQTRAAKVAPKDGWFFATDSRGRFMEFGMAMPEGAQRVIESLGYDGVIVDVTMKSPWAIALHPQKQVTVTDRGGVFSIPSAYAPLALEERIKAAIGQDPRPEVLREVMKDAIEQKKPLGEGARVVDWSYVTDADTLKGVLNATSELYRQEIEAQRRGVVTNAQSVAEAKALLEAGSLKPHKIGAAGNSGEILARSALLRDALNHTYGELQKIAGVPEADLTPAMKLQALAAIERVSMLNAEFAGVRAEAGRALQIFRSIKRDPTLAGEANLLLNAAERKGSLQDIAALALKMKDNPAGLKTFLEGYNQATTFEKVMEAWKAGILSGPQTHLANIMGNLTKYVVEVPESIVSASIEATVRAAKGDPMTTAQWKARAFAPIYGVQLGAKDALHVAAEVWKGKGESLEKGDVYKTAIEGKKGEIIRLPFKALQVEDALFRTMAERAEAYKMATDRAVKEGFHPETSEFRQKVTQYTQQPAFGLTEEAGLAAVKQIQNAGAEAVFAQRLGPFLETVQGAIAKHAPAMQIILPFVRTPANLVSWAVQHVPGLNLASGRWRADFAAGGERQARAIARVVIGAGLTTTALALTQDEIITGAGMFDKEQGNAKRAAGWQPYSIKIGDTYYSYQRIEPVAKVIGLAADLIELARATKDEQDFGKIASLTVLLFSNATISTTYLSGLSNVIQAATDPARKGEPLLEQYASSLVPKIIGQVTTMADPYKREVEGVLDSIQSQLPYFREKLLPKRDVWGEPSANERWFAVMPVATSQESQDKVRTEAARLQLAIQDVPRFVTEKGPFKPGDRRVELTQEQRDIFRQVSGKQAMTILAPIVNADDWSRIPDYAKAAIYKKVIEGTRKQGQLAALPPDDAARVQMRQKIVDEIIRQQTAADAPAPAPERRVR